VSATILEEIAENNVIFLNYFCLFVFEKKQEIIRRCARGNTEKDAVPVC
jgi:hypothetical protein